MGMPQRGWDSVTIPGAVSGWIALSKRYGKLPFADLFAPAIRYARDRIEDAIKVVVQIRES